MQKLALSRNGIRIPEQLKNILSSPKACKYLAISSRRAEMFREYCDYKCKQRYTEFLRIFEKEFEPSTIPFFKDMSSCSDVFEIRSISSFDPWLKQMKISCHNKANSETFEGNIHEGITWMLHTYEKMYENVNNDLVNAYKKLHGRCVPLITLRVGAESNIGMEIIENKIRDKQIDTCECTKHNCIHCVLEYEPALEFDEICDAFTAFTHLNKLVVLLSEYCSNHSDTESNAFGERFGIYRRSTNIY